MSGGIILDHHAVLALGRGHRQLSAYVVAAHEEPLYTVTVPVMCMAEATRRRPGVSAHLAQLAAVEIAPVDRIAGDAMGRIAAALFPEEGWPAVHAVATGLGTGWEIATTRPQDYKGFGVALMPVDAD